MLDISQIESFYPDYLRPFKKNILREYVQYKILNLIFQSKFGNSLVFMGGTAIHILYGNTRFSEDLDFDSFGLKQSQFKALFDFILKGLEREGYAVDGKVVFKNACSMYVRLQHVLYDYNISRHKQEILLIKIDSEPQNFQYTSHKDIINKFDFFFRVNTVPVDILLAQKIYAIFNRKRGVGRDFYDAIFLFGITKPNLRYLEEKMKIKSEKELKYELLNFCKGIDFEQMSKDVEQFIFKPEDSKKILLFSEYVETMKI